MCKNAPVFVVYVGCDGKSLGEASDEWICLFFPQSIATCTPWSGRDASHGATKASVTAVVLWCLPSARPPPGAVWVPQEVHPAF